MMANDSLIVGNERTGKIDGSVSELPRRGIRKSCRIQIPVAVRIESAGTGGRAQGSGPVRLGLNPPLKM